MFTQDDVVRFAAHLQGASVVFDVLAGAKYREIVLRVPIADPAPIRVIDYVGEQVVVGILVAPGEHESVVAVEANGHLPTS